MDQREHDRGARCPREGIERALSQWRDGAQLVAGFDAGTRGAHYARAVERAVAGLEECATMQQLAARYFAPDGALERAVGRACRAAARRRRFRSSRVVRAIVRDAACWCRMQQLVADAVRGGDGV